MPGISRLKNLPPTSSANLEIWSNNEGVAFANEIAVLNISADALTSPMYSKPLDARE
jgi:hypothetical protein